MSPVWLTDRSGERFVVVHQIECDNGDGFVVRTGNDEGGGVDVIAHSFPVAFEIVAEAGEFDLCSRRDDTTGYPGFETLAFHDSKINVPKQRGK